MTNNNQVKVEKILALAQLSTDDQAEKAQLAKDFDNILNYIEQLEQVDVDGVEALTHVHSDLANVFREDIAQNSLTPDDLLDIVPDASGNFIRVPLVIEDSN